MEDSLSPNVKTPAPYCRFPALRGDAALFVSAGDLWRLELGERGTHGTHGAHGAHRPRRLTDMAGTVSRPQLSPDGGLVAFASRHEGAAAIHVMDAEGGASRRIVQHVSACEPVAFTPDGARVLFTSPLASTTARLYKVFSVSVEGGDVREEPWGPASSAAMSADGELLVVGRGYQDPAIWKRYEGGLAGVLWAGRAEPLELERITPGPRGESAASFWGRRVLFVSDVDGTGNIWSCEIDGSDRRQHTHHETFHARWPAVDGDRVLYQHAAGLRLLDLATGSDEEVAIEASSATVSTQRRYVEPRRFIERALPSADGSRVLIVARGKVAVMPTWRGAVQRVADEDGVRYSHAEWMPDGAHVVLAHDRTGEERIEIRAIDGSSEPRDLGEAGGGRLRRLAPSPDGRWLAVSEHAKGLFLLDLESGERRTIDQADSGAIVSLSWSPDGRWLAYARPRHYRGSIFLHDALEGETHRVTSEEFDDDSPCFDPGGRYLYFLSRRIFNPYADELQHDVAFPATTKPFLVVLDETRPSPFAPLPATELGLEDDDKKKSPGADGEKAATEDECEASPPGDDEADRPRHAPKERSLPEVRVDLEGLASRVVEVPVREGRYAGLLATRERLFLARRAIRGMVASAGDDEPSGLRLVGFDLAKREEKTFATGVRAAALSDDGKHLLLHGDGTLRRIGTDRPAQRTDVAAGKAGEESGVIDLSRVSLRVDPPAEWRQIFHEAWRQQRGHFWTESMSSVDWNEMRERYAPLVERVRVREELSDLLWDLQGELGTSHAYVVGGDEPPRPSYRVGLLGCDFEQDAKTGRYRIVRIHPGDTWQPGGHSPLVLPGVGVREGDWLLAVEGREAIGDQHPWMLLERPGPAVTLAVAKSPDGEGRRDVVVTPLRTEYHCRYREWVVENQRRVDERTGERVGYVHVPDMQVAGLVEFHRGFLWQSRRDALIVDVRDNGGGNVSQILLEKLRRELVGACKARWAEVEPFPANTMAGPMVALCNERTGSDGDIFCQSWKQLGLGPLIGTRTWGGVVGIDKSKVLVDGGVVTQPEYAFWFRDRDWGVEGHGVDPDIVVELSPNDAAAGRDPQLERAIDEALAALETHGPPRLELPPPPDRSR